MDILPQALKLPKDTTAYLSWTISCTASTPSKTNGCNSASGELIQSSGGVALWPRWTQDYPNLEKKNFI